MSYIIQLISSIMGFIVQKVYHDGVVAFQPRSQGSLRENPGNEVGSFNGYGWYGWSIKPSRVKRKL